MFRSHFPFGTGALSAFLKRRGHETRMLHLEKPRSALRELTRTLEGFSPDLAGLSITACQAPYLAPIARAVKKWRDIPFLLGGVHATLAPERLLAEPTVDGVLVGEGEEAMLEYIQTLEQGDSPLNLRNFWFRRNGEILRNPPRPFIKPLDRLPYPDREGLDFQRILDINNGVLVMMVSRGCAWRCTFCSNSRLREAGEGTYVRNRSVPNALGDLEGCASRYRFRHVYFRDDTFPWDRVWAIEFLREYARTFSFPFDVMARADTLDEEVMQRLREAGCQHVFLGCDSGNPFIANEVLRRDQRNEDIVRVADRLNDLGIKAVVSNMVGLPYETLDRFRDTLELNRRIHRRQVVFSPAIGACPKIWVFNPFPGTPLYETCRKQGWLDEMPSRYRVYRESYLRMPGFPPREIERAYRSFRYLVYRDTHLLAAWFFRIYDSRLGQWLTDLVPDRWFGSVRQALSRFGKAPTPRTPENPGMDEPQVSKDRSCR